MPSTVSSVPMRYAWKQSAIHPVCPTLSAECKLQKAQSAVCTTPSVVLIFDHLNDFRYKTKGVQHGHQCACAVHVEIVGHPSCVSNAVSSVHTAEITVSSVYNTASRAISRPSKRSPVPNKGCTARSAVCRCSTRGNRWPSILCVGHGFQCMGSDDNPGVRAQR